MGHQPLRLKTIFHSDSRLPIMKLKFVVLLIGISVFISCRKNQKARGIDKDLYEMAKETSGFVWFKYSSALLPKSAGSGHNFAFLRTRFNSTAAAKLDSAGKVINGTTFPEGSLIVKELYINESTFSRYAIMYKKSNSKHADKFGWVWGYINSDGKVVEPANNDGKECTSCHTQGGNIDLTLMNEFFN